MSYSNAQYAGRVLAKVSEAISFGTATNATLGTSATLVYLPTFQRRTAVNKLEMVCTVIPDGSSTALKASFLNGTSTFATVALLTATVGQVLQGTVSTSYNTFTASAAAPTVVVTGTASASGDAHGSYDIYFEQQELFA